MIYTIVGVIGAILSLTPFIFMQMGKIKGNGVWYTGLNWFGAGLILLTMVHSFNLGAFLIEGAWFVISFVSWIFALRRR